MLSTTHSLSSALIVSKIPNPYLSLSTILATHFLFDSIPHWDTGSGMHEGEKTKRQAFFYTLIDLALAGILVFFLFQKGKPISPLLWAGTILGIAPDLAVFPALFLDFRPFPINYLEKFHYWLHRSLRFPWGLIPQIIIILLIILLR